MKTKTLLQLQIGSKGIIKEILTDQVTKERLESLGMISGSEVKVVRNAPFGCPRIYQTLNTAIAIRNETANQVIVEETHG